MIFSTYIFIFVFFPLTFLIYSLLLNNNKVTLAKWHLVFVSFYFYAYASGNFFPFFVASVLFNYLVGLQLGYAKHNYSKTTRKTIFALGITGNLLLLGYYKYTDFVLFNINLFLDEKLPYQNILLPIGISFFTFQLIAYLVDSYRGETKGYNFLNYLLFITFFPQLIVGPIVHHKDVIPQYNNLKPSFQSFNNIALGVFIFSIGCAKKLMMADPLTQWAQTAFDNTASLTMLDSWFASSGYTLSYYFDLSGYADMAIGLGLMFGIKIPMNFNSPYKARNFADYWRRWHMTLSKFLSDYVFRNIFNKEKGAYNFYCAIFITFLVSGFWHGAGWTFVVWGIVNGIFVILAHMMTRANKSLPFILAWFLTFMGVIGTRILFVSDSFADSLNVYSSLFDFSSLSLSGNTYMPMKGVLYIFVGLFITLALPNSNELREKFKPNIKFLFFTSILLTFSFLNMSNVEGFLYFQF